MARLGDEHELATESFPIIELPATRTGDVNRHRYAKPQELARLIPELDPDVLDLHEEPFSVAGPVACRCAT